MFMLGLGSITAFLYSGVDWCVAAAAAPAGASSGGWAALPAGVHVWHPQESLDTPGSEHVVVEVQYSMSVGNEAFDLFCCEFSLAANLSDIP